MDHSRITRLLRILTALGSGRPYTIDELAKMFSVARRTIFRDLRLLQDIGVPYFYDHQNQCCKIEPHFSLSCPNLTEQEAFALFLLVKMTKSVNFPFRYSLGQATLKIHNSLTEEIRQYCRCGLENITILPDHRHQTAMLDELFTKFIEVITKRRIVRIYHNLPDGTKCETIEMEPYHLRYSNDLWHVIGKTRHNHSVITISFNHIRKLELLDRFFFMEDAFDIDKYIGSAWSMEPQSKLYHVRLKFAPEIASKVAATQWHNTQTVSHNTDGSAIIEFYIGSLSEIKWWIFSYGDLVQVIEPPALREMIVSIAEEVVKLNQ